jgi:Tat protein secretion system quality control protein TatD with DNase activity
MCPCPSRHFEVAHNLPVVVHARDADADTLEVLTLR